MTEKENKEKNIAIEDDDDWQLPEPQEDSQYKDCEVCQ